MLFYNARVFAEDGWFYGGFSVRDGRFAELLPEPGQESGRQESSMRKRTIQKSSTQGNCMEEHSMRGNTMRGNILREPAVWGDCIDREDSLRVSEEDAVNLCGAVVLPGLVDIHIHGSAGADFSDGDADGLRRMARYLALHGVTSFLPTSMTLPYDTLSAAFQTAVRLIEESPPDCARVLGVRMEGPFLSEAKRGAQNRAYLRAPDYAAFSDLYHGCGGIVRIVDLAPELPGAAAFARQAGSLCAVSIAHTAAGYAEAAAVYAAGAVHLTHLYNAMPPLLHREPGPIGAALEREKVTTELICDGFHVHPAAVRAAFRLFPGRVCLISDALRCCGMPDGVYELGGQPILLRDGTARLEDGTLAGSAATLFECVRNAVRFGISPEEALYAASLLPARVIGQESTVGSIAPGKSADFLICDRDWHLLAVYKNGREISC